MSTKKERGSRTTARHHSTMIEFLENHPEMVSRKFKTAHSRQNYNKHWEELTETLNSLGGGEKHQHNDKK